MSEKIGGEPGRGRPVSAEEWAVGFRRLWGREPTMGEYQAALAAGEIKKDRDPSVQQMGEGFKQVVAGAKGLYGDRLAPAVRRAGASEFVTDRVVPAVRGAAASARDLTHQQPQAGSAGPQAWSRWAPIFMPAASLLAIICLFLPLATTSSRAYSYFSGDAPDDVRGEGVFLLLVFVLVIGVAIAAAVTGQKGLRVASGVVACFGGIAGVVDGFGNMVGIAGSSVGKVGVGAVFLGFLSLVVLACGVLVLLTLGIQKRPDSSAGGSVPPVPENRTDSTQR